MDGTLAVDGAPLSLTRPAGSEGRYTFSGLLGQHLGLAISGLTVTPASGSVGIHVYRPDNTSLLASCATATSGTTASCNLGPLPSSGTYTVRVIPPAAASTTLTLTLSTDVAAPIVANGAAQTFTTTRPGQNARYTFDAMAGEAFTFTWTGNTFAGNYTYVSVVQPNGVTLPQLAYVNNSACIGNYCANGSIALGPLAVSGTYSLFVDPALASTGQIAVGLRRDASAALVADGTPTTVNLLEGQDGRYTFNGTAGQHLGLGVSGITTVPANTNVTISVIGPQGQNLGSCTSATGTNCNIGPLPSAGSYQVLVDPAGVASATLTLTLSTDVTAPIVANGATQTFNTTRPGQNARYTFDAVAGDTYTFMWSGNTFAGNYTYVSILQPNGAALPQFAYVTNGACTGNFCANGSLALGPLAVGGTYSMFVDPALAATGQITVALRRDASAALVVDGASTNASLLEGQDGRYTFSGTAGQLLGLGVSGLTTVPANGTLGITVTGPQGQSLGNYMTASATSYNLGPLPSSGVYQIVVDPPGASSTALTLTLSTDVAAAIVPDGAIQTFSTTRPGQNARYTFNAIAGESYSLTWTGATFAGSTGWVGFQRPDGQWAQWLHIGNANCSGSGCANGTVDMPSAPMTGVYSIVIDPPHASTGQISVALRREAGVALAVDGAPTAITLVEGQNGRYTFSGTAGQHLGLGVSGIATVPASTMVNVTVTGPQGQVLANCSTSAGTNCNIGPLPSAGTYQVLVDPAGVASATLTLTLSTDAASTLVANGTSQTFSTTRPGQNARYTFNATAGGNFSVTWTGATFPGTWSTITVLRPDGAVHSQANFSGDAAQNAVSGALNAVSLPITGVYTVLVDPVGVSTGQVTLALKQDLTGTLALNGTPTAVSLTEGQNARYTFSGTAGQRLGLGVSGITTMPANANVAVWVNGPQGQSLTSCQSSTGTTCDFGPLPSTGTYQVIVDPAGIASAALTLTLSTDVAAPIVANGATQTFSTTRPGQNARYTFQGSAGLSARIGVLDSLFGSAVITLLRPDGAVLGTTSTVTYSGTGPGARGGIVVPQLPVTGTYTVLIDPVGTSVGSMNVEVLSP